jgi:hypothetical protein
MYKTYREGCIVTAALNGVGFIHVRDERSYTKECLCGPKEGIVKSLLST